MHAFYPEVANSSPAPPIANSLQTNGPFIWDSEV